MITPELFNRNDVLRTKLSTALDEVLELAFLALDSEEDQIALSVNPHDALAYSMAHARRTAIVRYKDALRALAKVPRDVIGPVEANYRGIDPFDQLRIDAEREHEEAQGKKQQKPKSKK